MSDFNFSKCPLCDASSPSERCGGGNIYFYHCSTCTDYFISRSAAKFINKNEPHRKGVLSKRAATFKNKKEILAITQDGPAILQEGVPRDKYHCV